METTSTGSTKNRGAERRVPLADGGELCAESFGDPADPALLLISGLSAAMDWWDAGFCRALATGGRFVIRYDHRDTGASRTDPPGEPSYTGRDLAEDALRVLDAYDVDRAHLAGISAGGGIAQEIALEWPERVASLTLVSTSAAVPLAPGKSVDDAGLPPSAPEVRELFTNPPPDPDWSDARAVVDHLVAQERVYAAAGFDEGFARRIAGQVVARSVNPASSGNHWTLAEGEPLAAGRTLADLRAPTVVLHGDADPFFLLPHGQALAEAVPGARFVPLEGVGHQVPPPAAWRVVVDEMLRVSG
ncbi:alpha/beta fold hydrolase [Myceligenerans pegani]|uniref:Alpha/beta hydrolase n=1 Tax=Myceligenerans pegani TaxID=2776917 RepID=A0ABR9MWP6_9MICO|nr:alpha/beta hydrolase [Myceligenerans sp. TRM 65318]MBE1875807.1 alpha/beta hydrolase [Myceligenerans sp. TRM 65318]MBE3018078.1 alpha/beta hydrolase [Myceligenerans sp. TRM 65318]